MKWMTSLKMFIWSGLSGLCISHLFLLTPVSKWIWKIKLKNAYVRNVLFYLVLYNLFSVSIKHINYTDLDIGAILENFWNKPDETK